MIQYLLDTHTFLWSASGSDFLKLSKPAKTILEDPDAVLFISSVSVFEIMNKFRQGKLPEFTLIAENIAGAITGLGGNELPLNRVHAERAGSFDWNHKDPFDRLLAAQAQIEDMILISCDKAFKGVPDLEVLW